MKQYEDIINHQRPVSRKHKPMSMRDMAAQFSSFAALPGLVGMVEEKRKNIEAEIEEKDH